ncbi:MAG: FAD-linked oxidase C-terminal domain-containing protein, partial [Planctomycetota bacterium]
PVNSSGYRLDRAQYRGVLDLGQLVTGSEGTLAVITQATLSTAEPAPMAGVLVLYFETLQLAADSVRPLLDHGPCSLDLIDGRALDLVRRARPDLAHFFRDKVQSVLVAEFDGADNDEVIPKLMEAERLLAEEGGTAVDSVAATAEPDIDDARAFRKAALNLLQNLHEPRRVIPFVEDIAVEPDMISSCARRLTDVLARHGLDVAVSGHVGHGNLSARPLLDLKDEAGVHAMREAAAEVFEMVAEMGGTISSGHGDGLARSEFLRTQYGDLCDVFGQVKQAFDPEGRLNPGIKVGAERGTIVSNLRYGSSYSRRRIEPKLLYPEEPRGDVIERCHGCGACRSLTDLVAMCPVYKALQTEEASPRAKANILRHVLSNRGTLPPEDEMVDDMARLTDLCLSCRMCSVECPAGIDVAKLMVELRARRAEKGGLGRDEKLARQWSRVLSALGTFPVVSNLFLRNRLGRLLAEKAFGIAAKRAFPPVRVRNLAGRHRPTLSTTRERVVYFTDLISDCCKPDVVECTRDVLVRNAVEVEIVSELASGKTRMLYGDVAGARRQAEKLLKRVGPLVEEGYRVVFAEPRAALYVKKEMLDCIDTPAARAVSAASFDLMQFLLSLHRAGRLDTRFRALPVPMAYHAPCHLRAMQIGTPALELLRLVPELPVADLGGGCCGMAGTFGLLQKNYDLSMQIGRPLFDELRDLDVRYGLTECSYCAMQLQQGSGKRVIHPIQVLHRAYGLPQVGLEDW